MVERLIDAHCLVGTDHWLSRNKPELAHQNMLRQYGAAATALANSFRSFIMPFPSSENGSFIRENEIVLQLNEQFDWAEPILAFNYRSQENFDAICRALDRGLAKGLVVWPIVCDLDLEDLAADQRFHYLISNFPCWFTIHVGAGNEAAIRRVKKLNRYCPEDAVRLAAAFPKVKFNLSHLLRISSQALFDAESLENIIIDISGIHSHHRWYECGKNVFPAADAGELAELDSVQVINRLMNRPNLCNKLVFGTQYPFSEWYGLNLQKELALIENGDLTTEQLDMLLYRNFEEFFVER